MTSSSERPPFPGALDSSMLKTFKACPRKFELQYLKHLHPREESIHLLAGGVFAKALEVVRRSFHQHKHSAEDSLFYGLVAGILEWGQADPHDGEPKGLWSVLLVVEDYFRHHGLATDPIQPLFVTGQDGTSLPAVEFSFALPLDILHPVTGEPLLYCGRSDFIGVYNNTLFIIDEKTTSRLGATWNSQWDLRSQFTGYCWAAKQYGYPVAGVVVRGVAPLKYGTEFADVITYRSEAQIARWLEMTHDTVEQMLAQWHRGRWTFNLDDACTAYSGCPFAKESCNKQDPDAWLGNFITREWRPLGHAL